MSQRSFPFDDVGGDRQLDTAQWSRYTAALTGNGVVPGFADELEVTPTAPETLAVDVGLGRFWVEGRFFEVFSAPETVALDTADPTDPRIDRIVARRSIANREVTVEALTGTPAPSPIPPPLTQSPLGDFEESLAQVFVAANETTIIDDDITDEREFALPVLRPGGWEPAVFPGQHRGQEDLGSGLSLTGVSIPVPEGVYSRLRLTLRGELNEAGFVFLRVNGDTTTGLHKRGIVVTDANGTIQESEFNDTTSWRVAQWSPAAGNTCIVDMMFTDVSSFVGYESTGARVGNSATVHRTSRAWGRLNDPRLVSSLELLLAFAVEFTALRWWLDGWRDSGS